MTPTNLAITSTAAQTLTFTFSDPDGYQALQLMEVVTNGSLSVAHGCVPLYVAASNLVYLFNDAGNALASGSFTPGQAGSVSNSQCTVQNAGAAVGSGTSLQLPVTITLLPGLNGTKTVYGYASDNAGLNSGYQTLGTFSRAANQPPVYTSATFAPGTT